MLEFNSLFDLVMNADVRIHDNSKVNKGAIKIIVFKSFL